VKKIKTGSLAVACSYIGAVVGAGFISGQEIVQFFVQFGALGLVGLLITIFIIIFGGAYVLSALSKINLKSFGDLTKCLFNEKMRLVVNLLINGYLIGGLIIMISGAGSILTEILSVNLLLGTILTSLLIYLTVVGKAKRLLLVNKLLVPILVSSVMVVAIQILKGTNFEINKAFPITYRSPLLRNWWQSVILYIGYNFIGVMVALVNIAGSVSYRQGIVGGIVGGLAIAFLAVLIFLVLWNTFPGWQGTNLPMVSEIKKHSPLIYRWFTPTIWIAMFTTAIAYALGVSKYIYKKFKFSFKLICFFLLLIMLPVTQLGFAKLVGIIYPFFGIAMILVLLQMIVRRGWETMKPIKTV